MSKWWDITGITVFAVGVMVLTFAILHAALNKPTVYRSYATKECIRVEPESFTCEELPETYTHVWVR